MNAITSSSPGKSLTLPISQWPMYQPATTPARFAESRSFQAASTELTTASPPTLVVLGEAPGAEEEATGQPFVGASGQLLRKRLLPAAGLDASAFHVLNTFVQRPPNNDLDAWTLNKTEAKREGLDWQTLGPDIRKRYLRPEHAWQLEELYARLDALQPDLILCLGGVAMWALTGDAAIGTFRGTFFKPSRGPASIADTPCLATYHPAAILRQWSFLPITWADLTKVRLHLEGALPAPLRREFYVNPTFEEIAKVYWTFRNNPDWTLGHDIETSPRAGQITCLSYCTATLGLCIPFWDKEAGRSYWPSAKDEVKAWRWAERFANLPNPKVMQNGLYDMQWELDAPIPMRIRNAKHDTAILHHALQPELPKALGTLASLYLNEPSWKQMRTAKKDEVKADE